MGIGKVAVLTTCSNCNAYAATDVFGGGLDIAEQHYCYNCGAKMEEKKEGISND